MRTHLYFAYGSNLNLQQMSHRCPGADPLGPIMLKGWRLVFRGVADVVPDPKASCPGGIWRITEDDERRLDTYEGVAGGLYRKEYIPIKAFEGADCVLVYVMNSTGIYPPSEGYLQGIEDGYRDFHMGRGAWTKLNAALRDSWDDKKPTDKERRRFQRVGQPRLARLPRWIKRVFTTSRNGQGELFAPEDE